MKYTIKFVTNIEFLGDAIKAITPFIDANVAVHVDAIDSIKNKPLPEKETVQEILNSSIVEEMPLLKKERTYNGPQRRPRLDPDVRKHIRRPCSETKAGRIIINALQTGPCMSQDLIEEMVSNKYAPKTTHARIHDLIKEGVVKRDKHNNKSRYVLA